MSNAGTAGSATVIARSGSVRSAAVAPSCRRCSRRRCAGVTYLRLIGAATAARRPKWTPHAERANSIAKLDHSHGASRPRAFRPLGYRSHSRVGVSSPGCVGARSISMKRRCGSTPPSSARMRTGPDAEREVGSRPRTPRPTRRALWPSIRERSGPCARCGAATSRPRSRAACRTRLTRSSGAPIPVGRHPRHLTGSPTRGARSTRPSTTVRPSTRD